MTKDTEQRMRDIGQAVNERVPEGFGYLFLVWPRNYTGDYLFATNDDDQTHEIFQRAGMGPTNRPPYELKSTTPIWTAAALGSAGGQHKHVAGFGVVLKTLLKTLRHLTLANDTKKRMRDIRQAVNERVPEGFGYLVLIWRMNDTGACILVTNDDDNTRAIMNRAGIPSTKHRPFELK